MLLKRSRTIPLDKTACEAGKGSGDNDKGKEDEIPQRSPIAKRRATGLRAWLCSSENRLNAPADLQRYTRIFAASPGQSKARKEVDMH